MATMRRTLSSALLALVLGCDSDTADIGEGSGGTNAGDGGPSDAASGLGGTTGSAGEYISPQPVPTSLVGREYLVDLPDFDWGYHLKIVSTTQARLTSTYGSPWETELEYRPGVALGLISTPDGGEVVGGAFSVRTYLAIGETAAGEPSSEALYGTWVTQCNGTRSPWVLHEATVRADDTATSVRVEQLWPSGAILPWEDIILQSSKPPAMRLSAGVSVSLGDEPVLTEWRDLNAQLLGVSDFGRILDWEATIGETLQLSGVASGTNGIIAPFTGEVRIADFGPTRASVVDFALALPPDLVGWVTPATGYPPPPELVQTSGIPRHAPSSTEPMCPSGCAVMAPGTTLLLRLTGSGSAVRIRGNVQGARVHIRAARSNGPASLISIVEGESTTDVPITAGTGDVFVTLTTELGKRFPDLMARNCDMWFLFASTLYLESVELVSEP
jgi:hypothetical protein